jgi:hypothetical protein
LHLHSGLNHSGLGHRLWGCDAVTERNAEPEPGHFAQSYALGVGDAVCDAVAHNDGLPDTRGD